MLYQFLLTSTSLHMKDMATKEKQTVIQHLGERNLFQGKSKGRFFSLSTLKNSGDYFIVIKEKYFRKTVLRMTTEMFIYILG